MQLGFETVGNATLICHDRVPVLVTDPWLSGPAYFGSWGLSHAIPDAQMASIKAAPNLWLSHGHPDHLSFDSLMELRDKHIYLSDHVGHRIADFLNESGFRVTVVPDRKWMVLSPRVRMQTLAHYNQDSILLVDIDGTLIINLNDAPLTVWQGYIKRMAARYKRVVLLHISGFGDADMINFFNESGKRIEPPGMNRPPIGEVVARQMRNLGANIAVPFSSLHRYQRSDSVWTNALVPTVEEYAVGFDQRAGQLLPAFVSYELNSDHVTALNPRPRSAVVADPKDFGDDWSESLSGDEWIAVKQYFERRPMLGVQLDFIRLLVGGEEHVVRWSRRERSGVTFEVPRGSLLSAVRYEIFDDLFIGNFMKTTLHGKIATVGLYPGVNPYLGKWADNGRACTRGEVREYLREYCRRAPLPYLLSRLDERARYAVHAHVPKDSNGYEFLRKMYKTVRA
jgi:hypothetical protein